MHRLMRRLLLLGLVLGGCMKHSASSRSVSAADGYGTPAQASPEREHSSRADVPLQHREALACSPCVAAPNRFSAFKPNPVLKVAES